MKLEKKYIEVRCVLIKDTGRYYYKKIKQSKNVFISADKSKNIHVMEKDNYYRYLKENIEVRKITDLF